MKQKSDRHIRVRVSEDEYTFSRKILQKRKAGGNGSGGYCVVISMG